MRKRNKVVSIVIAAQFMVLSTSVFANSNHFSNKDPLNWDNPTQGNLEAFHIEQKILTTHAEVEWTGDQLNKKFGEEYVDSRYFFPMMLFQADKTDQLIPSLMITDLPVAKFTRVASDVHGGEGIKAYSLRTIELLEDHKYHIYAAWKHAGTDNPSITMHSLQGFAQPAGTINVLSTPHDFLSSVKMNDAEPLNYKYKDFNFDEFYVKPIESVEDGVSIKKIKSYSTIESKSELDRYKNETAKLLEDIPSGGYINYAVTFKGSVSVGSLESISEKYGLENSQVYAAGKYGNGPEYTVSWFGSNHNMISMLNRVFPTRFSSFHVTEIEGVALGEDLQRLAAHPSVDVIDVEKYDRLPTGVYGLNQLFNE